MGSYFRLLGKWCVLTQISSTRRCEEWFLLEKIGEQEGDSDFSWVNFKVLEGHPSRDVQKALGIQS